MMYQPAIESARRIGGAPLGPHHAALLFDSIKSAGSVQYAFLLAIFDDRTQEPVYFVASEINELVGSLGGGSHFLGVFDGQGHANLGDSDDWGDPRKFFPEALRIAAEHFGIPAEPGPG